MEKSLDTSCRLAWPFRACLPSGRRR